MNGLKAENIARWGYPYVFHRFRFHMTLTSKVAEDDKRCVEAELQGRFEELIQVDYAVNTLPLFEQAKRDAPFMVRSPYPLNPEGLL